MSKLHCLKSPKRIDGLITFRKYMQIQWMHNFVDNNKEMFDDLYKEDAK